MHLTFYARMPMETLGTDNLGLGVREGLRSDLLDIRSVILSPATCRHRDSLSLRLRRSRPHPIYSLTAWVSLSFMSIESHESCGCYLNADRYVISHVHVPSRPSVMDGSMKAKANIRATWSP